MKHLMADENVIEKCKGNAPRRGFRKEESERRSSDSTSPGR
jgi:hypothetical protein